MIRVVLPHHLRALAGTDGEVSLDVRERPTQRSVLERIHRVMKPQGLLYVGHSENFSEAKDLFRLRGKTIYERV